jgi:3-oxoacyl-[acyl-carrier protein] reductase
LLPERKWGDGTPKEASMSTGRFSGRVAVVTGGARGIGAATAAWLGREGAAVALLDLDEQGARDAADELGAEGITAIGLRCDVTQRAEVEPAMAAVREQLGRLDVLVNNAGVTRDNLVFRMTDDEWDTVLGIHLKGSFLCSQAAQAHMNENRYGRIVCIASRALLGNRGQANYSAAKAGMLGLVRTMAIELGPFGITANAIAPGFIETAMTRAVPEQKGITWDEYVKGHIDVNSIKRAGTPDDVAAAVAYLASEDAGYVTGQVLFVAGRPVS